MKKAELIEAIQILLDEDVSSIYLKHIEAILDWAKIDTELKCELERMIQNTQKSSKQSQALLKALKNDILRKRKNAY